MDDRTRLNGAAVEAEGLTDWRYLRGAIHTRYATGDFVSGLALATAVTGAAEEADHHPDVDLRYPHVDIRLTSHDVGFVTQRDIRLARRITEIAAERGVAAVPTELSVLEIGLDTADHAQLKPFWAAVLGLSVEGGEDDEIVDPDGVLPTLWFQVTDPHDEPRQRFHLDLTLPHDAVERRIAAALDAGGTLVTDEFAPRFWVLADPDGNKVCLCTWQGRP